MNDPLFQSKPRALASLMQLTGDEPMQWSPGELGAILLHQLAAPLEYDLRTLAPGGTPTINAMTATMTAGPRPESFGDLVRHPKPPLELLRLMKDFAKSGRDNASLPPEVATVLYYAAITLGLLRHGARITELEDRALRKGIEWSLAQPWIDASLRRIFSEGAETLATR